MEVRIGVQHATRELVIESGQSSEEVTTAVSDALSGSTSVLTLEDERGRRVVIPSDKLAYVEIGEATGRHVGFGSI